MQGGGLLAVPAEHYSGTRTSAAPLRWKQNNREWSIRLHVNYFSLIFTSNVCYICLNIGNMYSLLKMIHNAVSDKVKEVIMQTSGCVEYFRKV